MAGAPRGLQQGVTRARSADDEVRYAIKRARVLEALEGKLEVGVGREAYAARPWQQATSPSFMNDWVESIGEHKNIEWPQSIKRLENEGHEHIVYMLSMKHKIPQNFLDAIFKDYQTEWCNLLQAKGQLNLLNLVCAWWQ